LGLPIQKTRSEVLQLAAAVGVASLIVIFLKPRAPSQISVCATMGAQKKKGRVMEFFITLAALLPPKTVMMPKKMAKTHTNTPKVVLVSVTLLAKL